MKVRIARIVIPVLILAAGAGGMVALVKSKPEREPPKIEERAWTVSAISVVPGLARPELVLFARVDSLHVTRLSSAVTADVKAVAALEGRRVTPEDQLITLDDRETQLTLAQRHAEVAELNAELALIALQHQNDRRALEHEKNLLKLNQRAVMRAQNLAERSVGSQSQLDEARRDEERQKLVVEQRELAIREHQNRKKRIEARLARAEAQRSRVMLDLERTRIHSPFEGRIAEVFVSPGDRVRPGDQLLTIFDTTIMELRAQIPLPHLPTVRAAIERGETLEARAVVDGREIRAFLHRLTAQIKRGSGGAGGGLFRVVEGNTWLQLGRTVELTLQLPPVHDAVTVPGEAIYGTNHMFLLDGERMKSIQVERLGELHARDGTDHQVIVRGSNLQAFDQVIVTQLPNAIDGLKVKLADPVNDE